MQHTLRLKQRIIIFVYLIILLQNVCAQSESSWWFPDTSDTTDTYESSSWWEEPTTSIEDITSDSTYYSSDDSTWDYSSDSTYTYDTPTTGDTDISSNSDFSDVNTHIDTTDTSETYGVSDSDTTNVQWSTTEPQTIPTIPPISNLCDFLSPVSCLRDSTATECVASIFQCFSSFINCELTPETPYLCADQVCHKSPLECDDVGKSCTIDENSCWNGECYKSKEDCPPLPRCPPMYPLRCADGCHLANESCSDFDNTTDCYLGEPPCESGYCFNFDGICTEFNGCEVGKIECLDGKCVDDIKQCSPCLNNTCQDISRESPFSVRITFDPSTTTTIEVFSIAQKVLCNVTIPGGAVDTTDSAVGLRIDSVPSSQLRKVVGGEIPYSPVVELKIQGETPIYQRFKKDIQLSCLIKDDSIDIESLFLGYINGLNEWEKVSLVTESVSANGRIAIGHTNHFSSFAVLLQAPEPEGSEEGVVVKGSKDKKVPAGLIIGLVVAGVVVAIAGGVASYIIKKRQNKKEDGDLELSSPSQVYESRN